MSTIKTDSFYSKLKIIKIFNKENPHFGETEKGKQRKLYSL